MTEADDNVRAAAKKLEPAIRALKSGKPAAIVHVRDRGGKFYRVDKRPFIQRLMSFIRSEYPS